MKIKAPPPLVEKTPKLKGNKKNKMKGDPKVNEVTLSYDRFILLANYCSFFFQEKKHISTKGFYQLKNTYTLPLSHD